MDRAGRHRANKKAEAEEVWSPGVVSSETDALPRVGKVLPVTS